MISSIMLHGRTTNSPRELVKNKIVYAMSSATCWACQENNNTNNAYNVQASGSINNNNKSNNSYAVRAACAYSKIEKEGWTDAYFNCIRKKKSSPQCEEYRLKNYGVDLWKLMYEVHERQYVPSTSTCFVVTRPKIREVFAAAFRDRIVQHWIVLRIEPLLEQRFLAVGDVSFNCRKGYGTQRAVSTLRKHIDEVTQGGRREAWIGRYDIRSFFNTINKRILLQHISHHIDLHYHGDDKDTLQYLLAVTILHCPQKDCRLNSSPELYELVPRHKKLLYNDDDTGMPIGNITSQVLANYILSFLDEVILDTCKGSTTRYIRFADDFVVVSTSKEIILHIRNLSDKFLSEHLNQRLHPEKKYLQRASSSMKFVGYVLCHGRLYIDNKIVGSLTSRCYQLESISREIVTNGVTLRLLRALERVATSINSYLGYTKLTSSYAIRSRLFMQKHWMWKTCFVKSSCSILKVKSKYHPKEYLYHETKKCRKTVAGSETVLLRSTLRHHQLRHRRSCRRVRV